MELCSRIDTGGGRVWGTGVAMESSPRAEMRKVSDQNFSLFSRLDLIFCCEEFDYRLGDVPSLNEDR